MPSDLKSVRLAVFDVDGVLTDGTFLLFGDGSDAMRFHVADGLGLKLLLSEGIEVALITGRSSEALLRRAEALGIRHIHRGVADKAPVLRSLAATTGIPLKEMLYLGDDLPDLPPLAMVGVPVAVANAAPEVKEAASFVTKRPGGQGAVREVAERLLRARGQWEIVIRRFAKR